MPLDHPNAPAARREPSAGTTPLPRKLLALGAAGFVLAVFQLAPPPTGLPPEGMRTLGLLLFAIILWFSQPWHLAVTSLWVIVLMPLLGISTFEDAVAGFAGPTVWLFISVLMLAGAMDRTTLGQRIAFGLIGLAKGRLLGVLITFAASAIVTAFLIPNAAARATILTTLASGVARATRLQPGAAGAKAMMLLVSFMSLIGSVGVITGASAMVYAATAYEALIGHQWTYLSWMAAFLPWTLILAVTVPLLLVRLYPPEGPYLSGLEEYLEEEKRAIGPMGPQEIKMLAIFGAAILLWMTPSLHGLPTHLVALAAMLALFFPGIEIVTWREGVRSLDMGLIFLVGAALALAEAFESNGVVDWLAGQLGLHFAHQPGFVLGLVILATYVLIRLGMNNMTAAVAIMIPVVFSLAATAELNPAWLGMFAVVGCTFAFLLPNQSVAIVLGYRSGYFDTRDLMVAGGLTMVWMAIVTVLFATWYWPWLGIAP